MMKIFKILICTAFVIVIAACHDNKNIYDYPDNDPTTDEKGNIGDPCNNNIDCKKGLLCIDKVCSEPVTDDDSTGDSDENPDIDGDDSDTEPADDADSDTNDKDTVPTDDTDTAAPDEDEPEDTDTQSDEDKDQPVYIPECGNGLRDPGEECDNGTENSDEPGIPGVTCRTNCLFARCQDGIKDEGEICDDGNAGAAYCSKDCHVITGRCGDGIQQLNEACDKALNPYCSDDCTAVEGSCGDGKINGSEVCDNAEPDVGEGEGTGPYYCNVSCSQVIGSCGDGIVQLNEECDDKSNNGRYGYCKSDCSGKGPYCGDGIVQLNEKCDKAEPEEGGGEGTGVYCSSDCKTSFGSCGDGIIQEFEACDKATFNQGTGNYCSDDCTESFGRCGDGIKQDGIEECDNGDSANDNPYCPYGTASSCEVCNRACRIQAGIPRYCGDGVVSTLYNEVCDPANTDDPKRAYCKSDCSQYIGYCGDGILQEGIEVCDPGIDPYCASDCKTSSGSCGDGTINGNEECDNGPDNGKTECPYGETTGCTVCNANCKNSAGTPRYCGDGLVDDGYEICDSGSSGGNYGFCKTDCSGWAERCGDGIINGGEECDNGPDNGQTNCDYGETSCRVCSATCTESDGKTAYCGDGIINGGESCDDGELNGTYGHCRAGCYGDGERCGDGIVNGDELCDDGEANNGNYGYCASDCMSLGRRCGDGIVETANGEWCDDGENNGKYKNTAPGYCNSDCQAYGEGGYCGDSNIDEGIETCDNGSNNNLACPYGETNCDVCNPMCLKQPGTTSYCGDGILDWRNDEVCDDGANNAEYGGICNTTCSGVPPKCGDGNIDEEFGEVCDDMTNNGNYSSTAPGYCSGDCKSFGGGGYCGDGEINGYETCDSGAMNGQYGGFCNNNCTGYTHYCGDGNLDSANGENCDDAGYNGTYGRCDDTCTATLECGDGIWQNKNCMGAEGCVELENAEEECDNGIANGTATDCAYGEESCTLCTTLCMAFAGNTAYCNDGILQRENCEGYENCVTVPGADEECDDGADNGNYGKCNADCSGSMPKCGDGIIHREDCEGYGENCIVTEGINEECDDGAENGNYGKCNLNCSGTVHCGDGIATDGEFCDNGPLNGTYNFCNETCTGKTGECGDGILHKEIGTCGGEEGCVELETAAEECDNGSFNYDHVIDCPYGEESCNYCTKTCTLAAGNTSYCGDGEIDTGNNEICDEGKDLNGTFGHCDNHCQIIIRYRCGDGKLQKGNAAYCGNYPLCTESLTENCCEIVEFAQGDYAEVCDDGALNNTPGHCNSTCDGWTPYCGDGLIQRADCTGYENCITVEGMDEECDDGGSNGYYGFCKSDCSGTVEAACGDGILHTSDCTDYNTCYTDPETENTVCPDKKDNCVEIPGAYEYCDEGEDNGKYYGHCDEYCSNTTWNGYCGDGIVQMTTDDECTAYVAADPVNRKLCSVENIEGCCKVVSFASGDSPETCDEADNNGYHRHCNGTCDGISSCGDGVIGHDEACEKNGSLIEPGEDPLQCEMFSQFKGGTMSACDENCMPIMTSCVNADSYTSPFFKTNQTKCYDNSGEITCPAAESSDFYGQEPNFSYTAQNFESVSAGILKETVSELFWQQATPESYGFEKEDSSFVSACAAGSSCTWEEAATYCSDLGDGGYNGWRLPTAAEFSTIMDYAASNRIRSEFTNSNGSYWTQERMLFSSADGTFAYAASGTAQVKCVRSDNGSCSAVQCQDAADLFVLDFDNAVITSSDEIFSFWYFGSPKVSKTWKDALDFCKTADVNGMNKMRLPTVNEIMSLIDTQNNRSLIPGFTGTVWTSTTLSSDAAKAYAVTFSSGIPPMSETKAKTTSNYVICVE